MSEHEQEDTKSALIKLSKLIQEKEARRGELISVIDATCVEPLTAYPTFCNKLLVP